MRILSRTDIHHALSMHDAIAMVRDAFAQLSTDRATVPLRVSVPLPPHDGVTLFMPAYLHATDALAIKIVSVHNRNPAHGLPLIHALVVVIDAATGRPLATMEGGYLTALRTGAASGVATDLLAHREAHVAAIFGAGVQGAAQLRAVCAVRPIQVAWIYDLVPGKAEQFVREQSGQPDGPREIKAADSPSQAVKDADVICTATTATHPVFRGGDLKRGAHINAIGAFTPQMQEIDEETLRRADKIVVDSRAGAMVEAGDLIISLEKGAIQPESIYAEIGEIAAGQRPGRTRDTEITFFKSVGNAVQDAAVARAVYDAAQRENLGVEIDLGM